MGRRVALCARTTGFRGRLTVPDTFSIMNVNKHDQRVLHALAQGGLIHLERDAHGTVLAAHCLNRDGWTLSPFDIETFRRLKRRRLIASKGGGPYRITRQGLTAVRPQLDNR